MVSSVRRWRRRGLLSAVVGALVCAAIAVPALAYSSQNSYTVMVPSAKKAPVYRSSSTSCPAGQHVQFGGFKNGVAGMRATTARQWTVDGFNLGGNPLYLTAFVYCASGPTPTRATRTSVIHGSGSATATCPAGKVVVGAGFAATRRTVVAVTTLERIGTNRVQVSAYLRYGISKSSALTAYAYCAAGPAPRLVLKTMLLGGAGGQARATCPTGTRLLFGGVASRATGSQPPLVFTMRALNQTTWGVADSTAGRLSALAYCR